MPALSDPEFAGGIRKHAENIVRRSRGTFPTLHSFIQLADGLVAEGEQSRVNGARDDEQPQRNGASQHDEAPRDEGMEISDG